MRYTVATLQYRQFFSLLAITAGASASLGLVLSLPSTVTVVMAHSEITTHAMVPDTLLPNTEPSVQGDLLPMNTSTRSTGDETSALEVAKITEDETPTPVHATAHEATKKKVPATTETPPTVFTVPFYSQLTDITATAWKKVGCGITSLAMLIAFYEPTEMDSVDSLLAEGIEAGAYSENGWTYSGLIGIANKHGLSGSTHDYRDSTMDIAFKHMTDDLEKGPVMASVHYTFKPTNPIPHLVIINGIKDGAVYYNDPAEARGGGSISVTQFKSGWKKRYLEFYKTT